MNDRIKEFKESARPEIDWAARYHVELNNGEKEKWMNEWFEKFAELIVRECANMAESFHHHQYDFTGNLELHEFIKTHFGVEE